MTIHFVVHKMASYMDMDREQLKNLYPSIIIILPYSPTDHRGWWSSFFARKRDKAFSFWAKEETWYRRQTNCNIEAITVMYLSYYEKIYCLLVFPPTLFHKGSDHLWSMLMLLFHLCFIFNFNLCRDCISNASSLLLFFKCHIPWYGKKMH